MSDNNRRNYKGQSGYSSNGGQSSRGSYSGHSRGENNRRNHLGHSGYSRDCGKSSHSVFSGQSRNENNHGNRRPKENLRYSRGGSRNFVYFSRESGGTRISGSYLKSYRERGRLDRTRSPPEMPETVEVNRLVPQRALSSGSSGTTSLQFGNDFKLKTEGFSMYHYDVKIKVDKGNGRLFEAYQTNYPKVVNCYMKKEKLDFVFVNDGKANLYVFEQIPNVRHSTITMKGTKYLISIKKVANVDHS